MTDLKFARKIAIKIITDQIIEGIIPCNEKPKNYAIKLLNEKQKDAQEFYIATIHVLSALEAMGYNIIKI